MTSPRNEAHRAALDKLFSAISDLSTLPHLAQRVMDIASDPQASVDDLRRAIEPDPVLVTRILRRVNSSHFAQRRRIGDLPSALSILGFREVRCICLTAFVSRLFQRGRGYRTYRREQLWRHCLVSARASRKLAQLTGKAPAEEAYVAGLLHHLGTILLDQYLHSDFRTMIDRLQPQLPTYVVEDEVFSFDHAQLAEFVARRWGLPEPLTHAVRYYAYPQWYLGPHRAYVELVSLADYFCSRAGLTSLGVFNTPPPEDDMLADMGIIQSVVEDLWRDIASWISRTELE